MARPLIALLTDFGLSDHYVGAVKGVLMGICRDAVLVDITHEIPAHDVLAGALALGAVAEAFPSGTIFLAVVDPGVGTTRRGLAARIGAHLFVGPDNGLLTVLWHEAGRGEAVELAEPHYQRAVVSRTFEGRDRFAPAAAWLARGTALGAFGPAVPEPVLLDIPEARVDDTGISGEVIAVDRFGNLVTSVRARVLDAWLEGRAVIVEAGDRIVGPIVATYADVAPGAACALVGSADRLEIACNGRSARDALALDRGAVVRVRRHD